MDTPPMWSYLVAVGIFLAGCAVVFCGFTVMKAHDRRSAETSGDPGWHSNARAFAAWVTSLVGLWVAWHAFTYPATTVEPPTARTTPGNVSGPVAGDP